MSRKVVLLLILSFIVLTVACSEQTTAPSTDEPPDDPDKSPNPVLKYRIYGSGLNYVAPIFTYTFFIENEGTLGFALFIDYTKIHNPDQVFHIGFYSESIYKPYSHILTENQFRIGEGKVGYEIRPNETMSVKIVGNITGNYSSPPNTVFLLNLGIMCTRYDSIQYIEYIDTLAERLTN